MISFSIYIIIYSSALFGRKLDTLCCRFSFLSQKEQGEAPIQSGKKKKKKNYMLKIISLFIYYQYPKKYSQWLAVKVQDKVKHTFYGFVVKHK